MLIHINFQAFIQKHATKILQFCIWRNYVQYFLWKYLLLRVFLFKLILSFFGLGCSADGPQWWGSEVDLWPCFLLNFPFAAVLHDTVWADQLSQIQKGLLFKQVLKWNHFLFFPHCWANVDNRVCCDKAQIPGGQVLPSGKAGYSHEMGTTTTTPSYMMPFAHFAPSTNWDMMALTLIELFRIYIYLVGSSS